MYITSYIAPSDVQIEQLIKNIKKGLTYESLSLCVNRLVMSGFITKSQANKYKNWYRKIQRGEL